MSIRANGLGVPIVALIGLSGLLVWLDVTGFQAQDLEFFGAKALVARYGPAPRMQSIGFVFSPLLVYGTLLLGSPITLQVLSATLAVSLLARTLAAVPIPPIWRWSWLGLILVQPAFALMLTVSPAWTLSTALLILLGKILWSLAAARPAPDSARPPPMMAIVVFGLALAPLMLLRYEAWLLVPLMGVIWALIYQRESWPFRLTVVAMTLFMSLVFIGAWLFANWLFAGDMWFFLNSPYSGWRLIGSGQAIQQAGLMDSWQQAIIWVVSVVPAYGFMAVWLLCRTQQPVLVTLILLIPLVFPAAALWQGSFTPQLSRFGLTLGLLPLLWRYEPPTRSWQRWLITGTLVLGVYTSVQLIQQGRIAPEESYLWHKFSGQSLPPASSAQRWIDRQQAKRRIASVLSSHLRTSQQVLMDDVTNFPLVYLVNDPRHFIMPYQYEFSPALQHPDLFADFILVAGEESPLKGQDRLLQYWPQLERGTLPMFTELAGTPDYRLFRRVSPRGNGADDANRFNPPEQRR
jgi:hypothetical protein